MLTRADECGAAWWRPSACRGAAARGGERHDAPAARGRGPAPRARTSPEIARALGIGDATVRAHLKDIYRRFRIGSRVELVNLLHDTAPDLGEDLS
ncbi:MAG: LuxR C-terminal-related transcriptional regulator [Myxococcota bacterium]